MVIKKIKKKEGNFIKIIQTDSWLTNNNPG